jgi:adenylate kinase family enzyme
MIFHISGNQGSGKTTLGNKLKKALGNKVIVKDFDELYGEFRNTKRRSYQKYIYDFIKSHRNKHIIFTGLDADICLGDGKNNNYYDMKADYKYYIDIDENMILRQKFLRQVDKLYKRKNWFIDTFLENKENEKFIRDKIMRFVDIPSWRKQMKECNKLYKRRGYKFTSREDIYDNILSKLL